MQIVGRRLALDLLRAAGGARFAVYGLENWQGTPVYVHAKACVIDDIWTCVGSDNLNLRSWTHDSELSCAVVDDTSQPGDAFGQRLRLSLSREHLDRATGDDADLREPASTFAAFRTAALRLDAWHAAGRRGDRPPGRLRSYRLPALSTRQRLLAVPLYHLVADPDGRPRSLRRQRQF
jgi:phosphatidylserine/phosphatidylglycerophosphate/cardiolipin synthase-like enzyme